ncbi:sensor histidine kinase [Pseudooctadecabacter sp.]|uniref:sensor histidine kinase n=1 Tax=Pseudooctadecabacter sp. TaxID=1966338 RepID=UPI0035C814D8
MSLARKWVSRFAWVPRSSTLRLSVLLSGIFAVGFVAAILIALTLGQRANERRLDATLETLAQGGAIADTRGDTAALILRPLDDLAGLPDPFRRAASRGGGTVFLRDDVMRSNVWRTLVAQDNADVPVLVAIPIDDSEDAQELLAQILWTTAAVVIALTLAIGVWAGLLARRRLAQINTTLGRLAAGDLSARTGHAQSKDDLDDISQNLDRTAADLERLVNQTRHLSASIAHDLRTPLARLRAQLEMLPHSDGRGAALEEASHLSDVFDTIMRVARIEAKQGRDGFEAAGLDDIARDMADIYGPVLEDSGKTLTLEVNAPATVQADRGMLVQAMANLIQNGLVHGGDQITVFVDGSTMGVADNGTGVDPEQFAEIIKPMVRLDAARSTQGSGLGLALVRAVADRHGARLDLSVNTPHGLKVSINFTKV